MLNDSEFITMKYFKFTENTNYIFNGQRYRTPSNTIESSIKGLNIS